jgi:chromatin segregation and condensation protein Rec8/ScpA/Scc1 (kleisin family)
MIITFLALLELCKMKLIQIRQGEEAEEILISARGDVLNTQGPLEVDESEYK